MDGENNKAYRDNGIVNIVSEAFNSKCFLIMVASFTLMVLITLINNFLLVGGDLYAELSRDMADYLTEAQISSLANGMTVLNTVMSVISFIPYILGLTGIWKLFMDRGKKPVVSGGYRFIKFYLITSIAARFLSSAAMVVLLSISAKISEIEDAGAAVMRFAGYVLLMFLIMAIYYVKGIGTLKVIETAGESGEVKGQISFFVIIVALFMAAQGLTGLVGSAAPDLLASLFNIIFHFALVIFLYKLKNPLTAR